MVPFKSRPSFPSLSPGARSVCLDPRARVPAGLAAGRQVPTAGPEHELRCSTSGSSDGKSGSKSGACVFGRRLNVLAVVGKTQWAAKIRDLRGLYDVALR